MKWSEGMFRELKENANEINIVVDKNFQIRFIASPLAYVFGIKPVALLGRKIQDFIKADLLSQWKRHFLATAHTSLTDEIEIKKADGRTLNFEVRVSTMLNRYAVQGLVLKLTNITDQKKRANDSIRSNHQLDEVIYKTTHDLKAPVWSALGLIQIAQQSEDKEKDKYINLIKKNLMKLDSFIEEMNTFFRIERLTVQREKIELEKMISEEVEILRNLHPNDTMQFDVQMNGRVELFSDQLRVRAIVTNMISNAIKYRDLKKENPFIKIVVHVDRKYCDICFEDNGIGIAPAHQQKIFDLFFRATDQAQGSGLGLFIVKDALSRLQGTIEVKSTVGVGTSFQVRIPNQLHQSGLD
jgi:PAS domain S-box-containing protein